MRKTTAIIIFMLACVITARAQLKLQPMFSDNMVLQQQTQAPIWGVAPKGKTVKIKTSWDGLTHETKADAQGRWLVRLSTPKAGGPYEIKITSGKTITLHNVMIGEVWLCTGQSNMELKVVGDKIKNYEQEQAEAKNHPNIRFLHIRNTIATAPQDTVGAFDGGWTVCSPKTIADFSACGYFFGRNLEKNLNVPIGLIETCWGGTVAEAWVSNESLRTMPDFADAPDKISQLPATNEARLQLYQDQLKEWNRQTRLQDKGFNGNTPLWAQPATDDSQWQDVVQPGLLENKGFSGFDGIVWLRKTVDIPASWAGKELTLELGPIDDADITFFNGTQIGTTDNWMMPRTYKVPAQLVKAGKNLITIRVFDGGGDGGLYGGRDALKITGPDNKSISLAGNWKGNVALDFVKDLPAPMNTAGNPNLPGVLYNAMLHPLIPYAIQGAIWYQGESNAPHAYQYRELLPLLINDWRTKWGRQFPFYIVQLANYFQKQDKPVESTWAELREAQMGATKMQNTGICCLIDIGEADNIHPKDKQETGRRLALPALAKTYGKNLPYSGPVYTGFKQEGGSIRIFFNHAEGLKTADGGKPQGFAVAGLDHKFHWADARIEGNEVVVSSPEVSFPIAVRYAWADNPVCNMYNSAGLPMFPFRSDDWKGITQK